MAYKSVYPWYFGNNKQLAFSVIKCGKMRGHEFEHAFYGTLCLNGIPLVEYVEDAWGGPAELNLQKGITKELMTSLQEIISHYYYKGYSGKNAYSIALVAATIIELVASNSKARVDNTSEKQFNEILNKDVAEFSNKEWKKVFNKEIKNESWDAN